MKKKNKTRPDAPWSLTVKGGLCFHQKLFLMSEVHMHAPPPMSGGDEAETRLRERAESRPGARTEQGEGGRNEQLYTYRGTSLIRRHHPLGPCRRPVPRALWWS